MTMGLGERRVIEIISSYIGKDCYDDVEIIRIDDLTLAMKCDMLVEGTDVPRGMEAWQIARKSIVAVVSDMASKGVRPLYALVSIALPRSVGEDYVHGLARGFRRACREFNITIVGGDTNEGGELVIDCCMLGMPEGRLVRRSGASEGDLIIVSGPFGYTKAGLKILLGQASTGSRRFRERAVRSVLMPRPRLGFGLMLARYATSAMDSSDGLAYTLHEMSKASGKHFTIERVPIGAGVARFARENSLPIDDLVFYAGEEYEIVATVKREHIDEVMRIAGINGCDAMVIGRVQHGSGLSVRVDGERELKGYGWEHLT
ncbi:MAG: thiamine-phosphate kinase [Candidatus Nitrosocaldus sp.]|nr:thiamine-phosphate kinase [Candidatus Nitrosocaldus sp.]